MRYTFCVLVSIATVSLSCGGAEELSLMPTTEELKDSMIGRRVEGEWESYSAFAYAEEHVEFFNDQTCVLQLESSKLGVDQIACKWTVLPDQRVKIEMSILGVSQIGFVYGRGDYLMLELNGTSGTYVRANSQEVSDIEQRVAANKLYQQSSEASSPEERRRIVLEAGEAGSPFAQFEIGWSQLYGVGAFEKDIDSGIEILDKLVRQPGSDNLAAARTLASWHVDPKHENADFKKAKHYVHYLEKSERSDDYHIRALVSAQEGIFKEALELQKIACLRLASELRRASGNQEQMKWSAYKKYLSLANYRSQKVPETETQDDISSSVDRGVGYVPQLPAEIESLDLFEGDAKVLPSEEGRVYISTFSKPRSIYWIINLESLGDVRTSETYQLRLVAQLNGPSNARSTKTVSFAQGWQRRSVIGQFDRPWRGWKPGSYGFVIHAQNIPLISKELEIE